MAVQRIEEYDDAVVVDGKSDLPHVSHTQISMFDECSLKWWLRYVCKIKKPQTIQILAGDIFHKIAAENFRQKATTGCDLDLDEMLDDYSTKFDAQVLERSVDIPVGKIAGEFKDGGLAALSYYMRNVAGPMLPRFVNFTGMDQPAPAVELGLLKRIPQTDMYYKGVLDLWEEGGTVIDYKVTGRKWNKAQIAKGRPQALAYGFLLGGPVPFTFHTCIRDSVKTGMFPIDVPISQSEIDGYVHHVWDVLVHMDDVRTGKTDPRVSSGYCNEQLCSYCLNECRDWKRGVFDAEAAKTATDVPEGEFIDEEE